MDESLNHATTAARRAFLPHFGSKLSPHFGRQAFLMIEERLRSEGDPEVALQIFLVAVETGLEFIREQGTASIHYSEAWFQALCCQILEENRREQTQRVASELIKLLDGEATLDERPLCNEPKALGLVRRAISRLEPPFGLFLRLDILESQSEESIRAELNLADREEYLQLKLKSLKALHHELIRVLGSGF